MRLTRLFKKVILRARSLRYPKRLRHMAITPRGLSFRPVGPDSDARDILWKGQVVGRLGCRHELRNAARGACFVVGTGPSMQSVDLSHIAQTPTFGVNGSILKFLADGVQPTYYSITDADFFKERFDLVRKVLATDAVCFFSAAGLGHICERDPSLLNRDGIYLSEVVNRLWDVPGLSRAEFDEAAYADPDFVMHPTAKRKKGIVGFSRDLRKGLFCGATITYRAIQISYYLGFRRVFLLGMDLGGQGRQIRFYESLAQGRPSRLDDHYRPFILPCFEIVRQLHQAGELEVFNCSPISRLPAEVTPKATFEAARRMSLLNIPQDRASA